MLVEKGGIACSSKTDQDESKLFEDESTPNSCMITNAINTKEYFERFF